MKKNSLSTTDFVIKEAIETIQAHDMVSARKKSEKGDKSANAKAKAKSKAKKNPAPVIAMVSGGSDSTALVYILNELHKRGIVGPIAVFHLNHRLRGADAYKDENFVITLAENLKIPYYTTRLSIAKIAEDTNSNIEATARKHRYFEADRSLRAFCSDFKLNEDQARIFTAHTLDDRVENFYMRSIVGTGPGGFRSMLYRNGKVYRPLLNLTREKLREFIEERRKSEAVVALNDSGDLWCEDATNATTDGFRTFVRHEIVPRAKQKNPDLLNTLGRTMNLIACEDEYMQTLAKKCLSKTCLYLRSPDFKFQLDEGALIAPEFGIFDKSVQSRSCKMILEHILLSEKRIENASIEKILAAFSPSGKIISGYTNNIQGNLAISANKEGVRIEPMKRYRSRRKGSYIISIKETK